MTPPTQLPPQFMPPSKSPELFGSQYGGTSPFRPPFSPNPPFGPPQGAPWQNTQRFRRCMNRMSFVTLNNRSSFWFYPTDIRRGRLAGFRFRRNRWEPYSIDVSRILRINCNY